METQHDTEKGTMRRAKADLNSLAAGRDHFERSDKFKFAMSIQEFRAFMSDAVPYWKTLGIELKEVEEGRAVFEGTVREGLLQNRILHGGVLASIADSACAVAAISRAFPQNYATTINLQVSYLRPVVQGRFRAEGRCIRSGRNISFCECSVYDERDVLVATASSQLLIVPRSNEPPTKRD